MTITDIYEAGGAQRSELDQCTECVCALKHVHYSTERRDAVPAPGPTATQTPKPKSTSRTRSRLFTDESLHHKKLHLHNQWAAVFSALDRVQAALSGSGSNLSSNSHGSGGDTHTLYNKPVTRQGSSTESGVTTCVSPTSRGETRIPPRTEDERRTSEVCKAANAKTDPSHESHNRDYFSHHPSLQSAKPHSSDAIRVHAANMKKTSRSEEGHHRWQSFHLPLLPQTPQAPKGGPPAAAPSTLRAAARRGTTLCNPKVDPAPGVKATKSLSQCLAQLGSQDWQSSVDGLKSLASLSPDVLQLRLHEVCLLVTEEVKNRRSVVSSCAIDTLAALHAHLGRSMDPEAETTGGALLLKLAQTTSPSFHHQANLALDQLVKGCSPGRALKPLLNTGLRHRCAAVRGSTALHLRQLADVVGWPHIASAGKSFTHSFLIAVSKLALDSAPEARHHGQKMLQDVAQHKESLTLFFDIVPEKLKRSLEKILQKKL